MSTKSLFVDIHERKPPSICDPRGKVWKKGGERERITFILIFAGEKENHMLAVASHLKNSTTYWLPHHKRRLRWIYVPGGHLLRGKDISEDPST